MHACLFRRRTDSIHGSLAEERREDAGNRCDASIADFFYAVDIPTSAVESPEFKHMLYCHKQTEPSYSTPSDKRLRGPLLKSCFLTHRTNNDRILNSDANTHGLSLQSDSATIHRGPFTNIIRHNPNTRPVCLDIVDSTDQLVVGGKKDARYIARIMIK